MTDRTELRRLLDEYPKTVGLQNVTNAWFELSRAAVSALPSLLDQLDAAEAALARVRELHASSGTAESQGYLPGGGYGYISPYCTGCEAWDEYAVAWPCPTIAAIGGDR